jgi:hypothetical protein
MMPESLDRCEERIEFFLECLIAAIDDEGRAYALEELRYWSHREDMLRKMMEGE